MPKKVTMYRAYDGKLFDNEDKASNHNREIALEAVDKILRKAFSDEKLSHIHYPNLSLDLVPIIVGNARSMVQALRPVIEG